MKLYSTSAAALRLGLSRSAITRIADALELGRGGNRAEARRNWLFTDAELSAIERSHQEHRTA